MADNVVIAMGVALVELNLGAGLRAPLDDPEDLTSFAVVLEGDGEPSPEALAAGGVLGLGDHAWVRTDALRRLAGPIATPEWEERLRRDARIRAHARLGRRRARRGARPRGTPGGGSGHARRGRRRGVSGALRDAVLLSFDNLGEAADLERHGAPAPGPHPSVTVGLPRALDALAALDLRATFFVEGLNAELYPQALRDIARGRPRGRAARLAPRALGRAVARRGGRAC